MPVEGLLIGATHTHIAPGQFLGTDFYNRFASNRPGFDPAWTQFLVEQIAGGVLTAAEQRRPALVAPGAADVWGVTRNRSLAPMSPTTPSPTRAPQPNAKSAAVRPRLHLVRVDVREAQLPGRWPRWCCPGPTTRTGAKWVLGSRWLQPLVLPRHGFPRVLPMQLVRIGALGVVALPFEITVEAGARIAAAAPALWGWGIVEVTVSSVAGEYAGYAAPPPRSTPCRATRAATPSTARVPRRSSAPTPARWPRPSPPQAPRRAPRCATPTPGASTCGSTATCPPSRRGRRPGRSVRLSSPIPPAPTTLLGALVPRRAPDVPGLASAAGSCRGASG